MAQPRNGGSTNWWLEDGAEGIHRRAIQPPSNTDPQAEATNSMPTGAMLTGLATSGSPPKKHQKSAKKAAGAYQLPPDL